LGVRPPLSLGHLPKYARKNRNNYAKSLLRIWGVHRMLREESIESPYGGSLEGVDETCVITDTIFIDGLFTRQREMRGP
jgi:hypothetical protein